MTESSTPPPIPPQGETWPAPDHDPAVTAAHQPRRRIERGPRLSTVVWGVLIFACGALIVAMAQGVSVDPALAGAGLLGLAGVALIIGAVKSAVSRAD